MSFLHPALLAGLALVAVPVILHLWLRPRPKKLQFPALRLLTARQKQNTRRLRLRHLWLLLLRMLVVALMVLAVTRPTMPPANYGLTWTESLVTGAILATALGAYFGTMAVWQKKNWPRHVWLTKRTVLRSLIGTITALLLLLCVAWPYQRRVFGEITSPRPNAAADLPVMAVYLFDTSLSMQYQRQNKTRMDIAIELATAHLGRLPAGSKVAVAETSTIAPTVFTADLSAVQSRVEGLKPMPLSRPMEDRLRAAIQGLENDRKKLLSDQSSIAEDLQQDRYLREIYLFTDLAKSAWRAEPSSQLKEEIAARPWLSTYLIDVGVDDPVNISLANLKLSREAVPAGGQLQVEATMRRVGESPADQTVELELLNDNGNPVKAGQQTAAFPPGGEVLLKFPPLEITKGFYQQGQLKVVGADPMSFDDRVFFSVRVLPPRKVLVVSDREADVNFWMVALESLEQGRRSAFRAKFVTTDKLGSEELEDFDVVCLINAGSPDTMAWEHLRSYVDAGGGLFVALGAESMHVGNRKSGINPVAYDDAVAQELLPGRLNARLKFLTPATLDLRGTMHSLIRRLDEFSGAIAELSTTDIRQYWTVTPNPSASVLAPYAAEKSPPALLERTVGQGRVLMLTTGVSSPVWNDLMGSWTYVVLADQITEYLTASSVGKSNWTVGESVSLRIDPSPDDRAGVLRMPDFKQLPQDVPKLTDSIVLRELSSPGNYELAGGEALTSLAAGFSLNVPGSESTLTKLTPPELDELLGKDRYAVSRELDSLVRSVQAGRLGQEVYSLVLAMLLAVFVMEQIAGAWFYRTDELPTGNAMPPAASLRVEPRTTPVSSRV